MSETTDSHRARLQEEVMRRLKNRAGRQDDIPVVPRSGPLELSHAQQRLWLLDQMEPGRTDYNSGFALEIRGRLDVSALDRALTALERRHESLRTTFTEVDGQGRQVVHAPSPVAVAPVQTDRSRLADAVAETYGAPFDLTEGPLWRPCLFRTGDDHHVLLVTIHHIVTDGWSMGILQRELDLLYRAAAANADMSADSLAKTLPELPFQYADYAAWQRARLSGPAFDASLQYWHDKLAHATTVIDLPHDHPRHKRRLTGGANHRMSIDSETTARLRNLAKEEHANIYMTLLVATRIVLARWSRQDDVVLGTVTAGRDDPRLQPLVGFFVNTLALRGAVDETLSFRENLRRTRDEVLADFDHVEVPFDLVVDAVLDERDPAVPPLVQVALILQNVGTVTPALGDLSVSSFPVARKQSVFDIAIEVVESETGLDVSFEFDRGLFETKTIVRMADDLDSVLRQAPDTAPLRQQPLRAPEPGAWCGPDAPAPATLMKLFTAHVADTPEAPAVVGPDTVMTYSQLDQRAARLAGHLLARGLGKGDRLGVCLPRGPELITAFLACFYAGVVYVPLDPDYPADRLAYMTADARMAAVLTSEEQSDRFPQNVACIHMGEGEPTRAASRVDQPAYMIYTSGSTGRPKGVLLSHRGFAAASAMQRDVWGIGTGSRVLQFASPSFDASIYEFLMALTRGAALVVVPPPMLAGSSLRSTLADLGVTHAVIPPALVAALEDEDLAGVTTLVLAGEAWSGELVERFGSTRSVYNGYGPTEVTVCASVSRRLQGLSGDDVPPLGKPIPGCRLQLLDRWLRPVSDGIPAELYIGSEGLALGYWNRAGLTAERFVADPHGPRGSRMYRTGDLVRRRPDGALEFLGRTDTQIKIRGYRVELGEIENVLATLKGVERAVATVTGQPGSTRLVAYVVPSQERTVSSDSLAAEAAAVLPSYMVPAAFVDLPEVPLTPNGKVDRRRLPAVDWSKLDGQEPAEPRTDIERKLAAIWCDLLGLDHVGVRSSFFRIGGDSVTAVRMVAKIAEELGDRLPVRRVFDSPTIGELAALLEERHGTGTAPAAVLERVADADRYPLSAAQRRLWFLQTHDPEDTSYNSGIALRLRGVNASALEQALRRLLDRHQCLRTVFTSDEDGTPMQTILPAPDAPVLNRVDLSHLPEHEREDAVSQAVETFMHAPYDLSAGPLTRCLLVREAPGKHVLAVGMHHIIMDAWSLSIISRDLMALYARCSGRETPALPPATVRYIDYAAWQDRFWKSPDYESGLAFWREQLAGLEPLDLPTDHARRSVRTGRGDTCAFSVPAATLAGLQDLEQRSGATLFMVLYAATLLVLSRHSGQKDIALGTVTSGRDHVGLENVVGFFVNTIAPRIAVDEDEDLLTLVGRVRDRLLDAFQHADIPFDSVVDAISPARDPSRPTLVQALISLQNAPTGDGWALEGVEVEEYPVSRNHSLFDVSVDFAEADGMLTGIVEYDADLFDPGSMAELAQHLVTVLAELAHHPEKLVRDTALMTPSETERILAAGTGPAGADAPPLLPEALLAKNAHERPDSPAVTAHGATVSFGELSARVQRTAAALSARGIGVGDRVATALSRSVDAVTGIFAVLQVGAAYVPVDPAGPADRVRHILSQSRARAVLTDVNARELRALVGENLPILPMRALEDYESTASMATAPVREPRPDDAAYIVHTSGSTGEPKGVVVTRANVSAMLTAYRIAVLDEIDRSDTGRELTAAHLSAWTFDASWDPLAWLLNGHHLHIIDEETRTDPEALCAYLSDARIDYFDTTPSYLEQLVTAGLLDEGHHRQTVLTVGAEALGSTLHHRLAAAGIPAVLNFYGPTESTVNSTVWRVTDGERPLIGRPVAGLTAHVLDDRLRPVPAGVRGELYLSGANVAACYDNMPRLTAERFVACPGADGARMYRTGDLVRWTGELQLEFLGRNDNQVKVRGFRIELGEVESALTALPDVARAAVAVREDVPGVRRLVGYVVPDSGASLDMVTLRSMLREVVPEYMVPQALVPLEALPLSSTGKTVRALLPPPPDEAFSTAAFVAPEGDTQTRLAAIWAQQLGVSRVGAHDNFFDLGGDSILSIRLVSQIRAAGWEVTTKDLFTYQTVESLAAALDQRRPASARRTEYEKVEGPVSTSAISHWFFDSHVLAPQHFDMSLRYELASGIDIDRLRSALLALVEHHDMLRLRAHRDADGWHQHLNGGVDPGLVHVVEIGGRPADEAVLECARRERSASRLENGPLFEAFVLAQDGCPRELLLSAHHLVVDAVSWQIVLEDLQTLYDAGGTTAARLSTTSFPTWMRRLIDCTRAGAFDSDLEAWTDTVSRIRSIPTDMNDGAHNVASERTVVASVPADVTEHLVSHTTGVLRCRIDDLLLAALAHVMTRWAGQPEIVIEKEGHGRHDLFEDVDLSRTVGWFTTLYPLALKTSPASTLVELVASVKRQTRQVPEGISYGALRYLRGAPDQGLVPDAPAPVVFNYLGRFGEDIRGDGVVARMLPTPGFDHAPQEARSNLLDITGALIDGSLSFSWTYSKNRHRENTVQRLANSHVETLTRLAAETPARQHLRDEPSRPTTRRK